MKSARTLMAVTGCLVFAGTGCMDWGLGRDSSPGRDIRSPFSLAQARDPWAGGAATEGPGASEPQPEASGDPQVAELTRRIDTLAERPGGDEPAGHTDPAEQAGVYPATAARVPVQPAMNPPTSAPAVADADARTSVHPPAVSASSTDPPSIAPPTETASKATVPPSGAPPSDKPAIAAMRAVSSEAAASPAPGPVPTVGAATVPPAPPPTSPAVDVQIVDVRPVAAGAPASDGRPAQTASANQPAQSDKTARLADLKTVIEATEQAVRQQPPHPRDELRLRLLYLAADMDAKSTAPLEGMDPIQAELLTAIVKAVASARQALSEPMTANPAALAAADDLRRLLSQQSGVTIPRVALVTKVSSYGDYEAISPLRFKAGSEIHAYVYTEVANYRSEPVEGNRVHTLLTEKVQVFDAAGKTVWEREEKHIEDRVRTPRRDFFIPFPVHLPASLPRGEYVLKVTIEDRIGGTTDQQRLSFSIQ